MSKTITIKGTERVPVDKTASLVTTPASQHYYKVPKKITGNFQSWDAPPPMYDKPPKIYQGENLIGTKRGMVEIVGYYGSNKVLKTSQWVARCACGRYELRNGKSWRKGLKNNKKDCCSFCNHTQRMNYISNNIQL